MTKKQRIVEEQKTASGTPTGMNNNFVIEKVPKLRQTNSQVLIEGKNNAFIKLGRDQDASRASGAGGKGYTQCGAIDIVVGLDGANDPHDEKRDPNFFNDSSRIYLTQKGKINHYFGAAKGSSSGAEKWDSGIGIKSDNVNIIGKKHIKLITSKARINSEERSGQGGVLDGAGKIDFIAGNFSGEENVKSFEVFGLKIPTKKAKVLQPLVKGDNLVNFCNDLLEVIEDLQGAILDNRRATLELATNYASHIHPGVCAVGPVVTTPTPMAAAIVSTITSQVSKIPQDVLSTTNVAGLKENYLNPNFPEYINSKNVNTT